MAAAGAARHTVELLGRVSRRQGANPGGFAPPAAPMRPLNDAVEGRASPRLALDPEALNVAAEIFPRAAAKAVNRYFSRHGLAPFSFRQPIG